MDFEWFCRRADVLHCCGTTDVKCCWWDGGGWSWATRLTLTIHTQVQRACTATILPTAACAAPGLVNGRELLAGVCIRFHAVQAVGQLVTQPKGGRT